MDTLKKAIEDLEDELVKAKKMPIGTVSKGRKKVAEGKWVSVKEGEKKSSDSGKEKSKEEKDREFKNLVSKHTKVLNNIINDPNIKSANDLIKVVDNKLIPSDSYNFKDYAISYLSKNKNINSSDKFTLAVLRGINPSDAQTRSSLKRIWKWKEENYYPYD